MNICYSRGGARLRSGGLRSSVFLDWLSNRRFPNTAISERHRPLVSVRELKACTEMFLSDRRSTFTGRQHFLYPARTEHFDRRSQTASHA
jgi:hypothetical protein